MEGGGPLLKSWAVTLKYKTDHFNGEHFLQLNLGKFGESFLILLKTFYLNTFSVKPVFCFHQSGSKQGRCGNSVIGIHHIRYHVVLCDMTTQCYHCVAAQSRRHNWCHGKNTCNCFMSEKWGSDCGLMKKRKRVYLMREQGLFHAVPIVRHCCLTNAQHKKPYIPLT